MTRAVVSEFVVAGVPQPMPRTCGPVLSDPAAGHLARAADAARVLSYTQGGFMTGRAHCIPLARIQAVWADADLRGYRAKAQALGVSVFTLHRWARDLSLPNLPQRTDPRKAIDAAALRAVWADAALPTMAAKAAALGCSVSTLKRRRADLGLAVLPAGPKRALNRDLLALLWGRGVSAAEIARLLRCDREVVVYTAGRMGLPRRGRGFVPVCGLADVVTDLQQIALARRLAAVAPCRRVAA